MGKPDRQGMIDVESDRGTMEKPWLSVIVPSHNGERWLAETLESLVEQREQGIEVIVIDASANEASLQIVNSFSDKLHIRAYRCPDLLSWMAKTNFGAEQARGEWICMLHQDDLWLPNRSMELREWDSHQPDAVMHLHPCYIIDVTGKRLGLWRCPLPAGNAPVPAHILYERLLIQNFIGIPTPTIRRDAYLTVGGLDESLWHTADWDLYLKIASTGNIYYHSRPLSCFRIHKDSLTMHMSKNINDFKHQHEIIVGRHIHKLAPKIREEVFRISAVSVEVNASLAAAYSGKFSKLIKAFTSILMLGPHGIYRYFLCSRIVERVFPRFRVLVAGRF
jgi:glycosyltransferase involved in cell wall biosynthesis